MTLSRKQLGRLAIACVIGLVCLAGSRIGYAERAYKPRYERCTGQAVTLVIVGDRGAADLSVAINRLTTIVFPHPIGDVKFPKTDAFDIYQLQTNTLLVWPLDLADVGDVITVSASTTSTDLRFRFSVVDDPLTATTVAMVMEQPPGKGKVAGAVCLPLDWQSAMSALQAGIIADKDARIDELQTENDQLKAQSVKQAEERARAEALLAAMPIS